MSQDEEGKALVANKDKDKEKDGIEEIQQIAENKESDRTDIKLPESGSASTAYIEESKTQGRRKVPFDKLMYHLEQFKKRIIADVLAFLCQDSPLESYSLEHPHQQHQQHQSEHTWVKHLSKAWIRWLFRANIEDKLDDIIPLDNIVVDDDIRYWLCKERKMSPEDVKHVKYPPERFLALMRTLHSEVYVSDVPNPNAMRATSQDARAYPRSGPPESGLMFRSGSTPSYASIVASATRAPVSITFGRPLRHPLPLPLPMPGTMATSRLAPIPSPIPTFAPKPLSVPLPLPLPVTFNASLPESMCQSYSPRHRIARHKNFFCVDERFMLSERQVKRLHSLFSGKPDDFEQCVSELLRRYHFFGGLNNHLAMPPAIYPDCAVEMFGTPFNTTRARYCSPFEVEVQQWGSLGSFFRVPLGDGLFVANPPFDENLMKRMAQRLVDELARTQSLAQKTSVLLTMPVWDSASQRQIDTQDSGLEFEALNIFQKSPFLRGHHVMTRDKCKYFDHFTDQLVAVAHTHLILLSNRSLDEKPDLDLDALRNRWIALSTGKLVFRLA